MKWIEKTGYVLSTGKVLATSHLAGLSVDEFGAVTYGWDGQIPEFGEEPPTKEERREIADYMVSLWHRYANTT